MLANALADFTSGFFCVGMDIDIIENEKFFGMKLWNNESLKFVSPTTWPKMPPLSASSLTFNDHFEEKELPEDDLESFKKFISSIPVPALEKKIQAVLVSTSAEILRSKDIICKRGMTYVIM